MVIRLLYHFGAFLAKNRLVARLFSALKTVNDTNIQIAKNFRENVCLWQAVDNTVLPAMLLYPVLLFTLFCQYMFSYNGALYKQVNRYALISVIGVFSLL